MSQVPDMVSDFSLLAGGVDDVSIASGTSGSVKIGSTVVAAVTRWTFDARVQRVRYAANDSGGFVRTAAGAKQGSGTVEGLWNASAASPLAVGTPVTLLLHFTPERFYTVPVVICRQQVAVEISRGDVISFAAEFETDGPWTEPEFE
jgi:hypothetical protein